MNNENNDPSEVVNTTSIKEDESNKSTLTTKTSFASSSSTSSSIHPKAKQLKIMIDKKLANINPVTKIVEPAFNRIKLSDISKLSNYNNNDNTNDGIKNNNLDTTNKVTKSKKKKKRNSTNIKPSLPSLLPQAEKQHIVNANPAIDKDKLQLEKHIFVKELHNQFKLDVQNTDSNQQNSSSISESKKGRKLRKEYTLPPKPVKQAPFYEMEMKKYEAAKYYLINQNKTTLAKTCKQFKVSVPTLITYMDKARVDTFLKTGKYSGTSAKRERRNVKNQYQEKDQQSDKWIDTIKCLIKDVPGPEEDQSDLVTDENGDANMEYANKNYFIKYNSNMTKEEKMQEHLVKSKQFMRNTQLKLQSLKGNSRSVVTTPKITANSNNMVNISKLHQLSHAATSQLIQLPPLRLPAQNQQLQQQQQQQHLSQDNKNNIVGKNTITLPSPGPTFIPKSTTQSFPVFDYQAPGISSGTKISIDFSRPSSSYYKNLRPQNILTQQSYNQHVPNHNIHQQQQQQRVSNEQMLIQHNVSNGMLKPVGLGMSSMKNQNISQVPVSSPAMVSLKNFGSNCIGNKTASLSERGGRKGPPSKLNLNNENSVSSATNVVEDSSVNNESGIRGNNINLNSNSGSSGTGSSGSFVITPPNSGTTAKDGNNPVL